MRDQAPKLGSWSNPSWWNLVVILPWAIGLVWLLYSGISQQRVAERQQITQGIITRYEPANHNRYGYTFSVKDKSYSGWESPKGRRLAVGQTVNVYYDPLDPSTNALTNFSDLSIETFGPIPAILLGIGAVAFVILLLRRRNRALAVVSVSEQHD